MNIPDVVNIESLIPQRPPFVMVGELVSCEGGKTKTRFKVEADNIFFRNGKLREPALVENIAQTAAARAGWKALQNNKPVAIGYIGAVQKLEILHLPECGDVLETVIEEVNQVFDVTLITGKIVCDGKPLATCEMKIFITSKS
jgi:predicted hotdog family 3-hydroxylacyl-ACP dehydratase